jgi:hypothetical protein
MDTELNSKKKGPRSKVSPDLPLFVLVMASVEGEHRISFDAVKPPAQMVYAVGQLFVSALEGADFVKEAPYHVGEVRVARGADLSSVLLEQMLPARVSALLLPMGFHLVAELKQFAYVVIKARGALNFP